MTFWSSSHNKRILSGLIVWFQRNGGNSSFYKNKLRKIQLKIISVFSAGQNSAFITIKWHYYQSNIPIIFNPCPPHPRLYLNTLSQITNDI